MSGVVSTDFVGVGVAGAATPPVPLELKFSSPSFSGPQSLALQDDRKSRRASATSSASKAEAVK